MQTILIIDDDAAIGSLEQEVLERAGYAVLRAYSGTEALLLLKDSRPDLVLLDLMLPGLSGEEVLPQLQGISVIVVSAKTAVQDKVGMYRRSFREVHSADAFRSWNRYRHSMQSGRGTDAGLQRYRCPQPHWLPVHVYSAWTGSTVPMGRRRITCTRSCCRYGKLSGLPPSRWQPHTLRSDKLP